MKRGYFGIGVENIKSKHNIGTLFRSANIFNADYIFTIGKRYNRQCSDTLKSHRHIPLFNFKDFNDFYTHVPYGCQVVGVEIIDKAVPLHNFKHPERCCYILGPEDGRLSSVAVEKCQHIICLPGDYCLNVSVAGSIVMYDRFVRAND